MYLNGETEIKGAGTSIITTSRTITTLKDGSAAVTSVMYGRGTRAYE